MRLQLAVPLLDTVERDAQCRTSKGTWEERQPTEWLGIGRTEKALSRCHAKFIAGYTSPLKLTSRLRQHRHHTVLSVSIVSNASCVSCRTNLLSN